MPDAYPPPGPIRRIVCFVLGVVMLVAGIAALTALFRSAETGGRIFGGTGAVFLLVGAGALLKTALLE